jgi:leukotriene A-4 hydrolase/aminopeptidase
MGNSFPLFEIYGGRTISSMISFISGRKNGLRGEYPALTFFAVQNHLGDSMKIVTWMMTAALLSCGGKTVMEIAPEKDIHSYANAQDVRVQHLDLDLNVDFEKRELSGSATWTFDNLTGTDHLMLDTRNLVIERVTLGDAAAAFGFGDSSKTFGKALRIPISPSDRKVTIMYRTTEGADALQWLTPAQTAGGQRPFLFTQSQAILARTWIPCQDGPGVRFTYTARISCPPQLLAVMSAENPTAKNADGVYQFRMEQKIPSYLMALAVGDLEFRPLGTRSGVYAEASMIERCVYEFADTEKMIETAESLYGPYRWGRYDLLVLPPSFPFGGMENPRLTFATPTILAGDRSLVSLVSHELAHSWSGNLVTNATWNDFWLNEGFTVYFERRIDEAVYGKSFAEMQASLGLQDLREEMKRLGDHHRDTWLSLDLSGRDPDEGVGDVAYEKGYFFLRRIEESIGRERFDNFLKNYFNTYAFQPMTGKGFVNLLRRELLTTPELEKQVNIQAWVYGPGIPDNCPQPQSDAFTKVEEQLSTWLGGMNARELKTDGWVTQQWLHFLRKLPASIPAARMDELDKQFMFTKSGNSEILCEWFQRCIENQYRKSYPTLEKYLIEIGRRKLVKPLYTKLAQNSADLEWAKNVYKEARPGYHAVTASTIDHILGVNI